MQEIIDMPKKTHSDLVRLLESKGFKTDRVKGLKVLRGKITEGAMCPETRVAEFTQEWYGC